MRNSAIKLCLSNQEPHRSAQNTTNIDTINYWSVNHRIWVFGAFYQYLNNRRASYVFCLGLFLPHIFSHKFCFGHWRSYSINNLITVTKPVGFINRQIHSLMTESYRDWRKDLPVLNIMVTDKELCRVVNWSPICFAGMSAIYERRRSGHAEWRLPDVSLNWLWAIRHPVGNVKVHTISICHYAIMQ